MIFTKNLELNNVSQKLDVSAIKTGIYIVHLENHSQKRTQKIIIK